MIPQGNWSSLLLIVAHSHPEYVQVPIRGSYLVENNFEDQIFKAWTADGNETYAKVYLPQTKVAFGVVIPKSPLVDIQTINLKFSIASSKEKGMKIQKNHLRKIWMRF